MTSSCLFSLKQSATHLGLYPPMVGNLYLHNYTDICRYSPICWMEYRYMQILVHSAKWLYSLLFSKMEHQNLFCCFFFLGGFSTDICSLSRFLKNFFLSFANIWFWLNHLLLFTYLLILWAFAWIFRHLLLFLVCCYFVLLFNSLFFSCRSFGFHLSVSVSIDNSALMLLIWSSILVFHIRCCHLLPFVLGIFVILPIFLDITYAFTYFSRLMFLRLGTSSAITSWIAWFACSINSSTFLFTYIMGRRGLTVIMMFSHSALTLLISLTIFDLRLVLWRFYLIYIYYLIKVVGLFYKHIIYYTIYFIVLYSLSIFNPFLHAI